MFSTNHQLNHNSNKSPRARLLIKMAINQRNVNQSWPLIRNANSIEVVNHTRAAAVAYVVETIEPCAITLRWCEHKLAYCININKLRAIKRSTTWLARKFIKVNSIKRVHVSICFSRINKLCVALRFINHRRRWIAHTDRRDRSTIKSHSRAYTRYLREAIIVFNTFVMSAARARMCLRLRYTLRAFERAIRDLSPASAQVGFI